MTDFPNPTDPNPVRPSQAEGDPEEQLDHTVEPDTESGDPKTNRPSQPEGEDKK